MLSVLIQQHIVKRFSDNVIPFLRAKGLDVNGTPRDVFERFLKEPMNGWVYRIRRPVVDRCYLLNTEEDNRVFDCPVRFVDPEEKEKNGSRCIRVVSVDGSLAFVREDAEGLPTKEHEGHDLIILSAEDTVFLLDTLPGTKFLNIANIWPSEKVPTDLSSSRPGWIGQLDSSTVSFLFLEWPHGESPAIWFATSCEACEGQGACNICSGTAKVACRACDGEGSRKCQQCHGEGRWTCQKCSGHGRFPCPKCEGTGDYWSAGGNRYDCNPCHGTGYWECHTCNGTGVFTCQECNGSERTKCQACGGTGKRSCPACINHSGKCFLCRGHGVRALDYDFNSGSFSVRDKSLNGGRVDVASVDVDVYDWHKGCRLTQKAAKGAELLRKLKKLNGGPAPARTPTRLKDLAKTWMVLEQCLDEEEKAGRSTLQEPLTVGNCQASTRREEGYVYYEFDILAPKKNWSQKGSLDWKQNIPLHLGRMGEDGKFEAFVPSSQVTQSLDTDKDLTCYFTDFHPDRQYPKVTLRFDIAIDSNSLPQEILLKPRATRPAQHQLRKHLTQFLQRENWDHPVLLALATGEGDEVPLPEVQINDKLLASNVNQVRALRLALSEAPFCLVKGPPGTGKTTLITEIVQQTVAQGKRVLVCSQTHQAVRNVMERLERLRYRMLRHVSEEKATDLDRRYSWRQMDSEVNAIFGRVEEKERSLTVEADMLVSLTETSKCGMAAADTLRTELARLNTNIEEVKTASQRRKETVQEQQKQEMSDYEEALKETLTHLHTREASGRKGLLQTQKTLNELKDKRDRLTKVLTKKGSASTYHQGVRAAISKFVIFIGIPQWASAGVLRRKVGEIEEQIDSFENQASGLKDSIKSLTESIQARERDASEWKASHVDRFQRVLDEVESDLASSLRNFERQKQQADSLHMPAIEKARAEAIALSFEPPTSIEHEEWQAFNDHISVGLEQVRNLLDRASCWKRDLSANMDQLGKYLFDDVQVFFSTCVGLASWRQLHNDTPACIDLVIIDEAGKATIPEAIIPAYYAKRLILIGDDMQLPPVRDMGLACMPGACDVSPDEDTCWLETSLFERLWREREKDIGVMLNTQHRMHKDIADFVSEVFYAGELLTPINSPNGTIGFAEFNRPVCLVPTMAWESERHETFEAKTKGYFNRLEAELVERILRRAEDKLDISVTVGVIAPYARQREHIRERVAPLLKVARKLSISLEDIDSIDSFQGGERDIVIISFTRSPEIRQCKVCGGNGKDKRTPCQKCAGTGKDWRGSRFSFLLDMKRLNVAFSRAKCMLIIVGDVDALKNPFFSTKKHKGYEIISRFNDYVQDRGKVLRVWEAGEPDGR